MADPQRGPVWEESIILSPKEATLLMLSASISNSAEIAAWIEQVRGAPVEVIAEATRPVELRMGFLHPDHGVLPLEGANGKVFGEVAQFYAQGGGGRGGFRARRGKGASPGRGGRSGRGRRRKSRSGS